MHHLQCNVLKHTCTCALLYRYKYKYNDSARSTAALVSVTSIRDDGQMMSQQLEDGHTGGLVNDNNCAVQKE